MWRINNKKTIMTKIKKAWNSLMYKLMFKNYECECECENKK